MVDVVCWRWGGKEERSGCSTKNKNPTRKCGDKIIRTAWRISNMDLLETTPAFSYCEKFSFPVSPPWMYVSFEISHTQGRKSTARNPNHSPHRCTGRGWRQLLSTTRSHGAHLPVTCCFLSKLPASNLAQTTQRTAPRQEKSTVVAHQDFKTIIPHRSVCLTCDWV